MHEDFFKTGVSDIDINQGLLEKILQKQMDIAVEQEAGFLLVRVEIGNTF